MDNKEILSHIDHTLLKAFATWDQIETLCKEAVENGTASVCVPPSYIRRIHENFPDLHSNEAGGHGQGAGDHIGGVEVIQNKIESQGHQGSQHIHKHKFPAF